MPNTYLHSQAQKFTIAQRTVSYPMRAKDLFLAHVTGMSIYMNINFETYGLFRTGSGGILSSSLDCLYPMIGTTKASLAMDFIRLVSGSYAGSPTATAGDGFVNFSTNTNSNVQYIKTGFTPPANQQSYHLSFNSGTDMAASSQIEMGSTSGQGLLLGMLLTGNKTLGNVYNSINSFIPTVDSGGALLSTKNVFIVSRTNSSNLSYDYMIGVTGSLNPDAFGDSPVSAASITFTPGQICIGAALGGPTGGITTKSCLGASCGPGLSTAEANNLSEIYNYLNTNK